MIAPWLDGWFREVGYLLVFCGALSENTSLIGTFLPGSVVTLVGAIYARTGVLHLGGVLLLGWLGGFLGCQIDYIMGRAVADRLAAHPDVRTSRWRRRLQRHLRRARVMLEQRGDAVLLVAPVIGFVRSFVMLGAGAAHMPYRRFVLLSLLATLWWTVVLCLLGYLVGGELATIQRILSGAGWVIAAVIVAVVVLWRFGGPALRRPLVAYLFRRPQRNPS